MALSTDSSSDAPVDLPARASRLAAPVRTGDEEFPMPFNTFAATLVATDNEVWTHWLRKEHGRENHLLAEWTALIDDYRNQPAYPGA